MRQPRLVGRLYRVPLWRVMVRSRKAFFSPFFALLVINLYSDPHSLVELIRLLLQYGAKVELANEDEETPIIQACLNGHVEAARFLKHVGASAMHVAGTKSGVLHMAVLSRSLPMVKEVLSWTSRPGSFL